MPNTIQYKDIAILSESNQYLKRIYRIKNSAGRNQIYDRINMLADFYSNAVLLTYEHPIMIVSNTKDIFIKRLRRMKKMIASDCSSDESSQHKSRQSSEPMSFQSSGFLHTIKTKDLSSKKNSNESSFQYDPDKSEESVYNIYGEEEHTPRKFSQLRLAESVDLNLEHNTSEGLDSISYLIIDIDDINKEEAEKIYKKLQNKQNDKKPKVADQLPMKKKLEKKSTIIITPIDFKPQQQPSESSLSKQEKFELRKSRLHSKLIKKDPLSYKKEYDATIRFGDRYPIKNKCYGHGQAINHKNNEPYYKYPQRQKQTQRNYMNIHDQYEIHPYNYDRRQKYYDAGSRSRIASNETEYYSPILQKFKKKEEIRERAIALLNGVRSEERFSRLRQNYDHC